jgi:glutamine synthetase
MGMLSHDQAGYFDLSTGPEKFSAERDGLDVKSMSINVETSHHELAVGQQEIDFTPENALRSADNLVNRPLYSINSQCPRKHGKGATFMPQTGRKHGGERKYIFTKV